MIEGLLYILEFIIACIFCFVIPSALFWLIWFEGLNKFRDIGKRMRSRKGKEK